MNLCGLTDSLATLTRPPNECPRCHTASRVGHQLCLACLLQAGMEGEESADSESFDQVLAEIDVRDTHWRIGNYEILEEIGRGGMGVIYRARQRHSRRIVALKRVLSYHADSRETLARFRREAEAAASLDHPNILPIYEVSESEDGVPFFSMKFAPGGSLQEVGPALRDNPREVVRLMAKVTRAVQYAHREGILHRDLKPGNILLDGRGEPLVSDFGLAKWLDASSDLTRTLTIFGTPGYIAPEQAEGPAASLKPTADVYSLGAILFDLLAGRPPFLGEHALAVIRQAAEKPAPKLRSLVHGADRDLETICSRCLEREPAARYPSAGDLAEDLERWLEGRSIIARPVLPPVKLWRWSRRNPVLSSSIATILVIGTLAISRQIQTRRLSATVLEDQLAAHSVAVIPFLDLDSVRADPEFGKLAGDAVRLAMSQFGPATVRVLRGSQRDWTGTGIQDEVREAARQTQTRCVLAGTVRKSGSYSRLSLHLLNGSGTGTLGKWLVEIKAGQSIQDAINSQNIARQLYQLLTTPGGEEKEDPDPTMENAESRAYYLAGRGLIERRTISDMDRAIACFEGAIRAEPRSIVARSYLAMACMGREMLGSRPGLMDEAIQAAKNAREMAPQDAATNRGLCFVCSAIGLNQEALEYGLRALEFGDRSERAFGQIANVWKGLGRPDRAILWYEKAKVSKQQPADYEALLGDCWTDLGLDDRAEHAYQAAMQYRPDLAEGWVGLCRLRLLQGDAKSGRQLCQAQLSSYATSPLSKHMAARVEFFARDYPEADRLYQELERIDPTGNPPPGAYVDIDCDSALARLKYETGDTVTAEVLLQKSIASENERLRRAPDNPEALYRLAAAEAVDGKATPALAHLQKAIESGWTDYRSPRIDPRFDLISADPRFRKLLTDLAVKVAELGRRPPNRSTKGE